MGRIIGIRHRRKKTSEGEARPTLLAIADIGSTEVFTNSLELEDDTAELDFLMGRYPIKWRPVTLAEDISSFRPHQCKWRKVGGDEEVATLCHESQIRRTLDAKGVPIVQIATKVPTEFDGLREGDQVAMIFGGSGDRFAGGLSRRGEDVGAKVYRIPPFVLAKNRPDPNDKENDHVVVLVLFKAQPELFHQVLRRDRDLIRVAMALRARQAAQKARIACEQGIYQSFVGSVFLSENGHFPEGVIEAQYAEQKASDAILAALTQEEDRREKELAKTVKGLDIWVKIFAKIIGVGPRLAAGIIAPIGNIQRFKAATIMKGAAKLKAFCGVHVMPDGRFPRRRSGELANWSPSARQSLFLLGDQFNRRQDSEWGKKLIAHKLALRKRHPDPVEEVNGSGKKVKRYTDGHIHRMATWRTLTRFVESLYKQWVRIEDEKTEV